MTSAVGVEDLLVAPIAKDSRFCIFRTGADKNGKQRLVHEIVAAVPAHLQDRVTNFPIVDWEGSDPRDREAGIYNDESLPHCLRSLTVINSKQAGGSVGGQVYFDLLSPLLKAFGIRHVYVATDSPQTICDHARSFSSSATVVIIGGDTSVHEFVNFLSPSRGTELRLSVIPAGTGNALTVSIGIESRLDAIRNLFLHSEFAPLCTFQVSFPPGSCELNPAIAGRTSYQALVVASWGIHAALVADSDSPEMRQHGAARFGMAMHRLVDTVDQKYYGQIVGTPQPISSPTSYLLFTTVSKLEAAFPISPLSEPPSSGKLFCVAVPAVPNPQLVEIMQEVYDNASHTKDPRVSYQRITENCYIKVEAADASMRRWCIDGSIVEAAEGTVTIHQPTTSYNGWKLFINK